MGAKTTKEPGRGRSGDQGTEEKGTTANATTHTQEGHTTTGRPAPPHPHLAPHDSRGRKHRTPYGSHQHTPTSHRKPHGEWRAYLHGENGPHPQRKPLGTPPPSPPSPPGDDPSRHKGHLTGTGRGQRQGHSDQG